MAVVLAFRDGASGEAGAEGWDQTVIIGQRPALTRGDVMRFVPDAVKGVWGAMVASLSAGDQSAATSTWLDGGAPNGDAGNDVAGNGAAGLPEGEVASAGGARRVVAVAVSERSSRHNAACRPDAMATALKGRFVKGRGRLVLALARATDLMASAAALGRAFPLYARKGKKAEADVPVEVVIVSPEALPDGAAERAERLCQAVRDAARLTDMPPSELHTDAFVDEVTSWVTGRQAGSSDSGGRIAMHVLRRVDLEARGFGGLAGVGRAASREPALVHVRWEPALAGDQAQAREPMAWVGKGIVFDTGGLSIKGKADMPGMKVDMGGAAAVWAAFKLAVELGVRRRIDAILCLAENSVGPDAMRPDDIITLYSGKTIEVNNTDAEGRLVLGDGVAYAVKDCGARVVVDLATLTGAQLMATGKVHAAIVSNDEDFETEAVAAGRASGDLCFPLPYAPELFRAELSSPVADLRNSVKDRMNAQSSCAAQFIAESLAAATPADATVRWLHVDMAGPVVSRDRATGFGVSLLMALSGAMGGTLGPAV